MRPRSQTQRVRGGGDPGVGHRTHLGDPASHRETSHAFFFRCDPASPYRPRSQNAARGASNVTQPTERAHVACGTVTLAPDTAHCASSWCDPASLQPQNVECRQGTHPVRPSLTQATRPQNAARGAPSATPPQTQRTRLEPLDVSARPLHLVSSGQLASRPVPGERVWAAASSCWTAPAGQRRLDSAGWGRSRVRANPSRFSQVSNMTKFTNPK